jgi:hypothetical protein
MSKVAHIIGNGRQATMYKPAKGLKITCNVPPIEVPNVYTTTIVDFKMCDAIHNDGVVVPNDWVCGFRPKKYMEMNPKFHMKYAQKVKEFYLELPAYAGKGAMGYTNFNCGHFAAHWAANKLQCNEIHMYGFDSVFDFDLSSSSDFILNSDRGTMNNARLTSNWRPVWEGLFREFPDCQFVMYHKHNAIKISIPENVEIRTSNS